MRRYPTRAEFFRRYAALIELLSGHLDKHDLPPILPGEAKRLSAVKVRGPDDEEEASQALVDGLRERLKIGCPHAVLRGNEPVRDPSVRRDGPPRGSVSLSDMRDAGIHGAGPDYTSTEDYLDSLTHPWDE